MAARSTSRPPDFSLAIEFDSTLVSAYRNALAYTHRSAIQPGAYRLRRRLQLAPRRHDPGFAQHYLTK